MTYENKLDYIRDLFGKETEQLKSIRNSSQNKNDSIYIYPDEGKLLQLLIKLSGVKTVIELGTLSGYSATWMLNALPHDGRLYTLEHDPNRAVIAKANINDERCRIIEGDAMKTLSTIESEGPFDMIFIDANKNDYSNYLTWAENNIRKGGLIIGDNTMLFDHVWNDNAERKTSAAAVKSMREFNLRLSDDTRYTSIMLPTEEGFTIAIKNF